jgi:uncharacterized protein (DUF433 family)
MATNAPVNIGNLIHTDPDFRGGRPCLAGTGTTVHTIAAAHLEGLSAEEILQEFPYLDLSRIHAALACYYANRAQIEADFEASRRLGENLAAPPKF